MNEIEQSTYRRLLDKSCEAFVMAIETYNRPSIKYRVEGFSFFICNAWELMAKAKILNDKGMSALYFEDNPMRTISLERCLDIILTNNKDPLKCNLKDIVRLRNTSTHFIVEEHEQIYAGLFQACVFNYDIKLHEWHGLNISDRVPPHFLNLSMTPSPISTEIIRAKYPPEIAEKFLFDETDIEQEELALNNQRYSVVLHTELAIVKNPKNADFTVAVNNTSDKQIRTAKILQDPKGTHPYAAKKVVSLVNKELEKEGISLMVHEESKKFTSNDLNLFIRFYDIKDQSEYAYEHVIGNNKRYTYSASVVTFIVSMIRGNPSSIIDELKGLNSRKRD